MTKLEQIQKAYEEKQNAKKEKIRQEPKKFKRFWKWVWFWCTFPWIWLWYNMKDWRTAIFILISLTIWSATVWVPGLLGFIFNNGWLLGLAGTIWLWWLSPCGSPFIELVVLTAIGMKAVFNKIKMRHHKKEIVVDEQK